MSATSSDREIGRLLAAGAYGVIESGSDLRRLAWAVDAALAGRACARSADADASTPSESLSEQASPPQGEGRDGRLTAREWQVADPWGLRNKGIAHRLNITVDGRIPLAIAARRRLLPKDGIRQ